MAGMEINAGEAFNTENRTVTQLVSWLQSQNPDSPVVLKGGGTIVFRRRRLSEGGGLEVAVTHERPRPRPKSKRERALEEAQVSVTDSPAEAELVAERASRQVGPGGKTALEDSFLEAR